MSDSSAELAHVRRELAMERERRTRAEAAAALAYDMAGSLSRTVERLSLLLAQPSSTPTATLTEKQLRDLEALEKRREKDALRQQAKRAALTGSTGVLPSLAPPPIRGPSAELHRTVRGRSKDKAQGVHGTFAALAVGLGGGGGEVEEEREESPLPPTNEIRRASTDKPEQPGLFDRQPRQRRRRGAAADPRVPELLAKMAAAFLQARGFAYEKSPLDEGALADLLTRDTSEGILQRWANALAASFPTISYVHELRTKWNHFGAVRVTSTDAPRPAGVEVGRGEMPALTQPPEEYDASSPAAKLWHELLVNMRAEGRDYAADWLTRMWPLADDSGELLLWCPDRFFPVWVDEHYRPMLEKLLADSDGQVRTIRYTWPGAEPA